VNLTSEFCPLATVNPPVVTDHDKGVTGKLFVIATSV
jgi:hypothetical protein